MAVRQMSDSANMENYEKAGAIALNSVFGFEPRISRTIIETLGSASAVFALGEAELSDLFGPWSKYRDKISPKLLDDAVKQLDALTSRGYQYVTIMDAEYPHALLECEDPPVGLYVRSRTPASQIFGREPRVSVVGTRDITPYGLEWCRRIVSSMSRTAVSPVIVSGLAIGVDINAHEAALSCGLPTIAVLPTGITDVYPSRHSEAARRMESSPGSALVTDYPPGTVPKPVNFLRRNRIIAGLSQATVLVESNAKGGGTMTARLAHGYCRDVYALPGRIDDARSMGCNLLIQEKIAEPVASLPVFLESLGLGRWRGNRKDDLAEEIRRRFEGRQECPSDILVKVAMAVKKNRGVTVEELCANLDLPYAEASTAARMLEQEGFIVMDLLQRCSLNVRL